MKDGESNLSVNTLIDICRALNIDANTILAGTFDTPSNTYTDSFLNKSFHAFSDKDRDLISYIVDYILSSK